MSLTLLLAFLCPSYAFPAIWIPISMLLPVKGQKGAAHKQIELLEEQWRAALLSGDTGAMGNMLADSYVGIGPDGTIAGKAEELQMRATGQEHLERLDLLDRKIRLYGTTAVVTSRVRIAGVYSGQPLLGDYRYTRVWTLSHAQWKIVSFEANQIHDLSTRSQKFQ